MSSLKDSYRFIGPQPIRRAKFPAFVWDRFMEPIKVNKCHGHAHGEFPFRDVRGVYVKWLFMTGPGERCDPPAFLGPD